MQRTDSTSIIVLLSIAFILFVLGAGAWFAFTPFTSVPEQKKILFEVERGKTPKQFCAELEARGIVRSGEALFWLGRVTRTWIKMKSAEYEFASSLSPSEILHQLRAGKGFQRSLLVREGENMYQIADRLALQKITDRATALSWMRDQNFMDQLGIPRPLPTSLEGYLSPNTYNYSRQDPVELVLKRMVQRYFAVWKPEWSKRAEEIGLTPFEVLTLASVIEKETGAAWERKRISAVFHNRLKRRMRLESDPTTIYGIWENYSGNLKRADLRNPSDYNTYTVPRLPIGPISNPSPAAIEATLYPEETDAIFFVSRNDGTHEFSATYADHQRWVNELQRNAKARQGKSWRDLKKDQETEANE